ncbi:MAG: 1-deoxy-D-xylulose-5-phosphate reductoisomerase [Candidatus Cloacimonadota bacterium]|nr:MAG: 1-deoxy-D-xylulose-5-phosphate reductoisomerase [Candidatus Cloacimonadota bacterium]
MKKIAVLGITGSIGLSTVEVVRNHRDKFQIVFASSNNNFQSLFTLAREFKIPQLVITNNEVKPDISTPENTEVSFGAESLQEALETIDCDLILNAISGSAGLRSSIAAITRGIDLALANKESLVMAGHIIMPLLKTSQSNLIPVDSEHSAIFQAINTSPHSQVKSLIITASGGPFRTLPLDEFKNITLEQTLKHPTWDMGARITIDSATMMNKGLEVIEAHWLFEKDYSKIKAIIHPQSIIHSFVEFIDGSILAQMTFPTMRIPILYALSYPERTNSNMDKTNVFDLPELNFSDVCKARYPLFFLALEAGRSGGILPTVMNAANEAAINLFMERKISYLQINSIIQNVLQNFQNIEQPDLETIISTNKEIFAKTITDYLSLV